MGITRRSLFGLPPKPTQGSVHTTRSVPLTSGAALNEPWPLLGPNSTTSMSNYLPLDGVLAPRSRLSSINTIRMPGTGVIGMAALTRADFGATSLWASTVTMHNLITSNGSISRGSFVSAFGLGVSGLPSQVIWQYAQAFDGVTNENMLLAVGGSSNNTILAIYQTAGASNGLPLTSYLTSAPKARAIGVFDNYVLAGNIITGSIVAPTRVQWNVRGSPSNWTSEGSGFEDLLSSKGVITAIRGTSDNRFIIFTDLETWYGVGAAYPAQFDFQPLDQTIGCPFPGTIQDTPQGILFLGNDRSLRLLPRAGGKSEPVVPSLTKLLRRKMDLNAPPSSWALYDPTTKFYHLFAAFSGGGGAVYSAAVVNTETGEWGFMDYNDTAPSAGVAGLWNANTWPAIEGLFFGNSTGTAFSTNSVIALENGSAVTSFWRSAPIAADLPGNYKQLLDVNVDYRATSKSTLTLKISQDGGNTYEATGVSVSLASAPVSGRAKADVYAGGAFPTVEIKSQSTGYELHRLDVTMSIGGQR